MCFARRRWNGSGVRIARRILILKRAHGAGRPTRPLDHVASDGGSAGARLTRVRGARSSSTVPCCAAQLRGGLVGSFGNRPGDGVRDLSHRATSRAAVGSICRNPGAPRSCHVAPRNIAAPRWVRFARTPAGPRLSPCRTVRQSRAALAGIGTRSPADGDSRSATQNVRQQESRFSRLTVRGNAQRRVGVADRRAQRSWLHHNCMLAAMQAEPVRWPGWCGVSWRGMMRMMSK